MKRLLAICIVVGTLFLSATTVLGSNYCRKSKTVAPDGFDSMLVYMATGLVDQTTDPVGGPRNCANGFCDGTWFHTKIMHRDQAEMNYLEALAKKFYLIRFGIDVDVQVAAGRIIFSIWDFDTRNLYRNYINSNRRIFSGGSEVRDGGWQVVILDPAGLDLGGEFVGMHVDAGSVALWGNYNIAHRRRNGRIKAEENIYYRAGSFFRFDDLFETAAICQLTRQGPEFIGGSQGVAQIAAKLHFPSATEIKFSIRNVLTFGDSQPQNGLGLDELEGTCGQ